MRRKKGKQRGGGERMWGRRGKDGGQMIKIKGRKVREVEQKKWGRRRRKREEYG